MPAPNSYVRVLVIANETCPSTTLCSAIADHVAPDGEVLVVAPALNKRLAHYVSDTDQAVAQAQERLARSIQNLDRVGIKARGEVGDADPIMAIEDALPDFPADALIIATHTSSESNWLERDVVVRARRRWLIPINHVVINPQQSADLPVTPASS